LGFDSLPPFEPSKCTSNWPRKGLPNIFFIGMMRPSQVMRQPKLANIHHPVTESKRYGRLACNAHHTSSGLYCFTWHWYFPHGL
jgi:hypothetical protein